MFSSSYRLTMVAGAAAVFAMAAYFAPSSPAAETMKGGQQLLQMNQINTPAQAEDLKAGDQVAMVCAKCKSVVVERVNVEKGHIKTVTVGEKHMCPGCKSTIEVVGQGRGKTDAVKHVCKACGDDSAFCCASKPGEGHTMGMEKKLKK